MHVDKYERYWLIAVTITLSIFFAALVTGAVVYGIRLDDPTGFVDPRNLDQYGDFATLGTGVHEVTREDGSTYTKVVIIGQRWSFDAGGTEYDDQGKEIIHVPQGEPVTFVVSSPDIQHGFIITEHNINFQLLPGQISQATTTFNEPGEYKIICHEYCGRQHQGMWMTIIVDESDGAQEAAMSQE